MERKTEFNVGDKVICGTVVGKVINIAPKRKDIKVDFGRKTLTFGFDGWTHGDVWTAKHIEKWTPEKQKIIDDKKVIYECKHMFEDISRQGELTPDMARKIMVILNERMEDKGR